MSYFSDKVIMRSQNADIPSMPQFKLTDCHILLGNANNKITEVQMSGDVSIDNTGLTNINENSISNNKLAQVPMLTIKGNNLDIANNVSDLTVSEVIEMLDIGSIGNTGSTGEKGNTGNTGVGIQGEKGNTGNTGVTGNTGAN